MEKKRFLFDANNFDEAVPSAKIIPEEEYVPPVPTYSEEELKSALESAREEAFRRGKQEGFRESEEGFSRQLLETCQGLQQSVESLLAAEDVRDQDTKNAGFDLIRNVLLAGLPDLMARGDFDATLIFLSDTLNRFDHEKEIVITVQEDYIEPLQNYFEDILKERGQDVTFKPATEGQTETLVSWKSGGAVRDPETLKEKLLTVLEEALAETVSSPHNEVIEKVASVDSEGQEEELKKPETKDE